MSGRYDDCANRWRWRLGILAFAAHLWSPLVPKAGAQTLTATITLPSDGSASADFSLPIQWTSVANVQTYYLYVGTSVGAKDLVDTGETLKTSYLAPNLPAGQLLYARLWTKAAGVWRYVDSSFKAAPPTAKIAYPADGATGADLSQPIRWTRVADVQTYYLYVGTTPGAKDLVNTGETLQTSYLAGNLPAGVPLYARMWTRAGGVWRFIDSSFSAAPSTPLTSTLTYPANGSTHVDLTTPLRWTTIPNVQAYYLYVGTTLGAKDLVNTGETLQTSYLATLAADQLVYARLWTKVAGVWRYVDSTFSAASTAPQTATLIYPANGASGIDPLQPARWTSVDGAQSYYLYVGSTPGAKDVVDSYETQLTTFPIARVPAGTPLYARLWTRKASVWRYVDSVFTAAPAAPAFVYPTDGAINVTGTPPFQWIPPAGAQAHQLLVGTAPGADDVFSSGTINATSRLVPTLPQGQTLYARVLSNVGGTWRHSDIAFSTGSLEVMSTIEVPFDGESAFDTARAFEWSTTPLARGYRLTIGTTPGGSDVHDSGEIHVTRRFVPNLPLQTLYGRLQTRVAGQ